MPDAATAKIPAPPSLAEVRRRRKPLKNASDVAKAKLSTLDRVALFITTYVGTMGFFLIILAWTIIWLGLNTLLPARMRFDPATGFVLYLFLCNVIQILLMPLIMVGQNIQGAHSEARAENDLEVNIKAEKEIETVLEHLEYQNELIIAMVEKLGCDVSVEKAKHSAHAT